MISPEFSEKKITGPPYLWWVEAPSQLAWRCLKTESFIEMQILKWRKKGGWCWSVTCFFMGRTSIDCLKIFLLPCYKMSKNARLNSQGPKKVSKWFWANFPIKIPKPEVFRAFCAKSPFLNHHHLDLGEFPCPAANGGDEHLPECMV